MPDRFPALATAPIRLHRNANPAARAAYGVRTEAVFGWLLSYAETVYIISVHPL
jgi:hypothetical protein